LYQLRLSFHVSPRFSSSSSGMPLRSRDMPLSMLRTGLLELRPLLESLPLLLET